MSVLTKQTSLLSWPRLTCHFDLLLPTHLILICQTRVCFGRNRAQGHTRAWACYRLVTQPTARFFHPDLTMEMALKLPISLFKWRWYWQGYHICFQRMWAWQTSVHLQLPCSLITKRAHAHWVGHGQTYLSPPSHNLHVDHNGTSQFLEPQYPPLLPFHNIASTWRNKIFSSRRLPTIVTLGHSCWSIRWLPIYFSVPRILFRTNQEVAGGEVENEGLQLIE